MAAVAPAPSLGPSEPSSHRGSLATDLDDNSTLATEPSVPASIRTSASQLSKNWSSNLAALDLHSPRLPSQSGGTSVASRASKGVKRGDVIRKMAPAAPPPSVATAGAHGDNEVPCVPSLPAAIPAALVLAPERRLAPPKSKNPYAYADSYDLSPGSFQSSLETGALILPPALQTHLRLKDRAHGEGGDGATEDSPTSVAEGSCVPSAGEDGAPIMLDQVMEGALVVHSASDARDEWRVVPAPSTNTQLVPAHPASGTANAHLDFIPGEHPLIREHRLAQLRGQDPAEIVRDRTLVPYDGPADPPGESPELHPVVCGDLVARKGGDCEGSQYSDYSGMSGRSGRSGRNGGWRKVKWMDPKSVKDEGAVDYAVLERYEALAAASARGCDRAQVGGEALIPSTQSRALVPVDPSSAAPPPSAPHARHDPTLLRRNPRTRIATISSGYKKARFFVREDLDTRIYFHQLEDAVGYMATRGYKRMGKAEEKGWRELLGRAHGVVKKGAKKEKQRYRKGRLVLVLKKTVRDHDDGEGDARTKAASSRRRAERKVQRTIAGASRASGTMVTTGTVATTGTQAASDASQATGRTSLGKSVRGHYKSYSEKFLAEQEEDKRQYLLAVAEGRPLPQIGYGGAHGEATLLLTDGSPNGGARGGDPDADLASNEASYGGGTEAKSPRDLHKSVSALSDRKGVYGGGVRYFTPDDEEDEEDESEDESEDGTTEDDEDFAEEDEYSEDEDETFEGGSYDEEATEYTEQSEEGTEASGSGGTGSTFSEEEGAAHDVTEGGGVESVDGSSSSRGRRRRRDGPPRMEPIGDDDESSTS